MRAEKKYLVDEVGEYLDKSEYVFLANYDRITVAETAELRQSLLEHEAEFHVVKNSVLRVAAEEREYPDLGEFLAGPTAIVVGGNNPPGVAKALGKFFKDKDKIEVKAGVLDKTRLVVADDVARLAKLPPLEVVRAQLLGLLNTPAQQVVAIIQTVPQSFLNVLKAKADQGVSN